MILNPVLAAIPFLPGVGPMELIVVLAIVLILFGPKRLPQLGKSIGKTMKALREGAEGKLAEDDTDDDETPAAPAKKAEAEAKPKEEAKDEAKV